MTRPNTWRSLPLPIINDYTPVKCVGEKLSKIIWQGRQWAVTEYGLEKRNGTYHIEKERLLEFAWEKHITKKDGCDVPDFCTALMLARFYFGMTDRPAYDWDIDGEKFDYNKLTKQIDDLLVKSMPLQASGDATADATLPLTNDE